MPNTRSSFQPSFRAFAALLGVGLLAYLVLRTGPQTIWRHVQGVGWGLLLIIALAGVAHLLKTWAWRLTFTCEIGKVSWPRSFAMRLISEAIAQIGIAGKVLGEGMRVSLLGSAVPLANGISSGALDAGFYTLSSAVVTVLGLLAALLLAPASGKWRLYALLFTAVLLTLVILFALAIARRWQVIGNSMRILGKVPRFQSWVRSKQAVIDSTEDTLLRFHHESPAAFWGSLALNFVCHGLAVLEVYIILHFLGVRIAFVGALVLEALTKLVNLVGTLNPGNVGTYEGGNVLITKLFGISAGSGLTLALCRRARAIFWAAIGAVCLIVMRRLSHPDETGLGSDIPLGEANGDEPAEEVTNPVQRKNSQTVIVLATAERTAAGFLSPLAPVGTLPVVLRAILSVRADPAIRFIICAPTGTRQHLRSALRQSRRMPASAEWREVSSDTNLCSLLLEAAATSRRVTVLLGNRIYQPRLLQNAMEWNAAGALALTTGGELAGIYAFSQLAALELNRCKVPLDTLSGLHSWMQAHSSVEIQEVAATAWHEIVTPEDLTEAEKKLDTWLVKPTDGLFARSNRKVSIPISRQLIRLPITPNIVTFFVLGVSFASGVLFARGGYWSTLLGAILSVAASILDGCDGEVARLKLQSTSFGCWLETVCDYLYYLFVFGGMAIGLTRSSGTRSYLAWGGILFLGAIMSFVVVSFTRQRLSGSQPEKFLAVWQEKADRRPSNPLLYLGRHTEFIIRRCFFPYALLFFATVNMTQFAFIATAVGANLVWLIALYSLFAFSRSRRSRAPAVSPATFSERATT